MLSLKSITKLCSAFALLLLLSSFIDVSGTAANFNQVQTEIVVSDDNIDQNTVNYYLSQKYISQKVTVNQFTVFSFKSLLKGYLLNFNITLKTQKKAEFQFLDTNSILKQNLIAHYNTSHVYNAIVK